MKSIVSVDPFRCRLWKLHDRLEEHVNEKTCRAEIQSFLEHGQLIPALGRRLTNDAEYDVELIYGARRLFVARFLNHRLQVELRDLSDREAIIAMDLENQHRKELSPYERGIAFSRWMRAGLFASQHDIAKVLRISGSQVSRLLKLARLPTIVVDAFGSAEEICEGWGAEICALLEHEHTRDKLIGTARKITSMSPRPGAREVYRRLLSSCARRGAVPIMVHDRVVQSAHGIALFRVQQRQESIALILPLHAISGESLKRIERSIAAILESAYAAPSCARTLQNDAFEASVT